MINKTKLKELGSRDLFCSNEDLLDAFKIKMPKILTVLKGSLSYHFCDEYFSQSSFDLEVYT